MVYRKRLERIKQPHLRDGFSRLFFKKKNYIKLIYGTPYCHTPTGLVERGVRTLIKDNLLTNIKTGERFGKELDITLEIMRKKPHTRLKKSAIELLSVGNRIRKTAIC